MVTDEVFIGRRGQKTSGVDRRGPRQQIGGIGLQRTRADQECRRNRSSRSEPVDPEGIIALDSSGADAPVFDMTQRHEPQRYGDARLDEPPVRHSGHPFHDRSQDRIAPVGIGVGRSGRMRQRARGQLLEDRIEAAERTGGPGEGVEIVDIHHAGRVQQQLLDPEVVIGLERGQVTRDTIVDRKPAVLLQQQDRDSGDLFADRPDPENSVGAMRDIELHVGLSVVKKDRGPAVEAVADHPHEVVRRDERCDRRVDAGDSVLGPGVPLRILALGAAHPRTGADQKKAQECAPESSRSPDAPRWSIRHRWPSPWHRHARPSSDAPDEPRVAVGSRLHRVRRHAERFPGTLPPIEHQHRRRRPGKHRHAGNLRPVLRRTPAAQPELAYPSPRSTCRKPQKGGYNP